MDVDGVKWCLQQGTGATKIGEVELNQHVLMHSTPGPEDTVKYDVYGKGDYVWAHRLNKTVRPQRYLDYLYVKNGALSFKISEESESFADVLGKTPPHYIDVQLRNKLADLNDIQILHDYSTFIH